MDDGLYVTIPSHLLFPYPEISHGLDEFLTNYTCTHTHSCHAPSSVATMTHTHTCLHTHTQVAIASGEDDVEQDQLRNPSRKPLGNREAVRKYREKKKAHVIFLEEEVKKLRAANQQLLRRLQGHAALEAEVVRLSSLLLHVRGKIDAEFGDILHVPEVPEDREIDEGGIVSGDDGVPEVADSVDAVASFVNSAA